jgi:hypothetical protein
MEMGRALSRPVARLAGPDGGAVLSDHSVLLEDASRVGGVGA